VVLGGEGCSRGVGVVWVPFSGVVGGFLGWSGGSRLVWGVEGVRVGSGLLAGWRLAGGGGGVGVGRMWVVREGWGGCCSE